jgi:hypothetical protein
MTDVCVHITVSKVATADFSSGKNLKEGNIGSYKERWLTFLNLAESLSTYSFLPDLVTMRLFLAVAVVAVPSALAFPWLKPEGLEALMSHPEAREAIERRLAEYKTGHETKLAPRQANTGAANGIVTLLGGTLSAVEDNLLGLIPTNDAVKGLKKFPEGTIYVRSCQPDI